MSKVKIVQCKVCGAEIASNAKTCPHCGAKNKKKRPILFILIGVIVFFAIIGGISGGSDCHGTRKTHISMGTGCGNLAIPYSVLEELKKLR